MPAVRNGCTLLVMTGGRVAWFFAQEFPDRLLTLTSLSVPHPAAFLKAVGTSRQALASWYMLFFQLPRLPEWLVLQQARGPDRVPGVQVGTPELAEAEVKAMESPAR